MSLPVVQGGGNAGHGFWATSVARRARAHGGSAHPPPPTPRSARRRARHGLGNRRGNAGHRRRPQVLALRRGRRDQAPTRQARSPALPVPEDRGRLWPHLQSADRDAPRPDAKGGEVASLRQGARERVRFRRSARRDGFGVLRLTVWRWRNRLLKVQAQRQSASLGGVVEVDETYFKTSIDPPPLKWSALRYGSSSQGGRIGCRGRGTSPRRSSRSCGRWM